MRRFSSVIAEGEANEDDLLVLPKLVVASGGGGATRLFVGPGFCARGAFLTMGEY